MTVFSGRDCPPIRRSFGPAGPVNNRGGWYYKPAPTRRAGHLSDGERGVVAADAGTYFAHVTRGAEPEPAGSPRVQLPAATPRHPGALNPERNTPMSRCIQNSLVLALLHAPWVVLPAMPLTALAM